MPSRALTPADLTAALERLRLSPAAADTDQQAQAQIDVALARMAALIDLLRDAAPGDGAELAERLLLADLAQVAGRFRAQATATGRTLTVAVERLDAALPGS